MTKYGKDFDPVTCSEEEFWAWCKYADTKYLYEIFIADKYVEFLPNCTSSYDSDVMLWCEEMYGFDYDDDSEPTNLDEEGIALWTYMIASRDVDDDIIEGIVYFFQRKEDAEMFVLAWKQYFPIIFRWVNE